MTLTMGVSDDSSDGDMGAKRVENDLEIAARSKAPRVQGAYVRESQHSSGPVFRKGREAWWRGFGHGILWTVYHGLITGRRGSGVKDKVGGEKNGGMCGVLLN